MVCRESPPQISCCRRSHNEPIPRSLCYLHLSAPFLVLLCSSLRPLTRPIVISRSQVLNAIHSCSQFLPSLSLTRKLYIHYFSSSVLYSTRIFSTGLLPFSLLTRFFLDVSTGLLTITTFSSTSSKLSSCSS